MLLIALLVVSAALLVLLVLAARIFRNVGPMDLEDYARRNHVVYIPVAEKLAGELKDWSKPVRLRLDTHRHSLLAELIIKPEEERP